MVGERQVIGLTGPLASGKSFVAQILADAFAAQVLDADVVVHDLQQPGTLVTRRIAEAFGKQVLDGRGGVDRSALSEMLLQFPAKLAELNGIVHPAVRAELRQRVAASEVPLVILEVPLLFQSGLDELCDKIIVTLCPPELRWARAQERPGMTQTKFELLNSKQLPDEALRARADIVLDTELGREELIIALDSVLSF